MNTILLNGEARKSSALEALDKTIEKLDNAWLELSSHLCEGTFKQAKQGEYIKKSTKLQAQRNELADLEGIAINSTFYARDVEDTDKKELALNKARLREQETINVLEGMNLTVEGKKALRKAKGLWHTREINDKGILSVLDLKGKKHNLGPADKLTVQR